MADVTGYAIYNGKYVIVNNQYAVITARVPSFSLLFTGYVLSDQGEEITQRGFIYGTSPGALNSSIISSDTTPSLFRASVDVPAGTYYYKAYAINSLGTSYGEIKSIIVS